MKKSSSLIENLSDKLQQDKIATMDELKKVLHSQSRMTVFRKLKDLGYITSYSHSAKFYSLQRIAEFDKHGLWFYKSVSFSKQGTLIRSVEYFVNESDMGYNASELERILKIKVDDVLLANVKKNKIVREKISGVYVYFSKNYQKKKQQELFRKDTIGNYHKAMEPEILMNELKASLIIFFSSLDEQQRRLYAGFESLKVGHGGDKYISEILDINAKTVSKGRKELLEQKIKVDSIRKKGGGRKEIKKNPGGN